MTRFTISLNEKEAVHVCRRYNSTVYCTWCSTICSTGSIYTVVARNSNSSYSMHMLFTHRGSTGLIPTVRVTVGVHNENF